MNESVDSIETAERRVADAKAVMSAEYHAVVAKTRRSASSPLLVGGILLGALAIGYFAAGKRRAPAVALAREKRGVWPQLLQIGQILLPLLGALKAAQESKAGRKAIVRATGDPAEGRGENFGRPQ